MGLVAEARFPEGADRLLVPIVEECRSAVFSDREALAAIYVALLTSEVITGCNFITIQSTLPRGGMAVALDEDFPYGNCTDPYTNQCREYLEQRAQFSANPLSSHLHSLLGWVQF